VVLLHPNRKGPIQRAMVDRSAWVAGRHA
jgi:hypothetical protein